MTLRAVQRGCDALLRCRTSLSASSGSRGPAQGVPSQHSILVAELFAATRRFPTSTGAGTRRGSADHDAARSAGHQDIIAAAFAKSRRLSRTWGLRAEIPDHDCAPTSFRLAAPGLGRRRLIRRTSANAEILVALSVGLRESHGGPASNAQPFDIGVIQSTRSCASTISFPAASPRATRSGNISTI